MSSISPRVAHYESFYRGVEHHRGATGSDGISNVLVYGNCQAEALRVVLALSDLSPLRTVRIPPVFELTAQDIPFLARAASSAQILLAQPVAEDYQQLPLGTRQVAEMMPPGSTVIRWPVIRFAGLHPWQAIVRHPVHPTRQPPLVPYHDLRTLVRAGKGGQPGPTPAASEAILAVGEASRAELRRREIRDCDVAISDLFQRPRAGDVATINHPGNRILTELARRLQEALGYAPDAPDPGRTLLGSVVAPVEPSVARALGLAGATAHDWRVDGVTIRTAAIEEAQMRWYADNPAVVRAGWERHRATIEVLGLA